MLKENLIHQTLKGIPKDYSVIEKMVMPYRDQGGSMIIIDDGLANELDGTVAKMFEQLSNNGKCSIIFVTQNLFIDQGFYRCMASQCQYVNMMYSPRSMIELRNLAMQITQCNIKFVVDSYKDASKLKKTVNGDVSYGYLFFDLKTSPYFNPLTILRTNLFDEKDPIAVYKENEC